MTYLDYNATTPTDPAVGEAMMPVLWKQFGNPSSTTHGTGMAAADLIDKAREQVSAVLGRVGQDVIFTSGATEANNMVLFGLGHDPGCKHRVLVGSTEHKSVLETCSRLGAFGLESRTVPVDSDGVTDLNALDHMLDDDVDLVSVMAANSETGVIQPVKKIAEMAHDHGALFHCDATQAIGKIPFNADDLDVDIVTMSSHKIYGPKGCGAIVATREARKQLVPMIHGGGQEEGMRSGTLNVPGIVGFGVACDLAISKGLPDAPRQESLRDRFESMMAVAIDRVTINGSGAKRIPNTSNIRIADALADAVIVNAPAVELATGSACSSSTMEPSHVLIAMGMDRTAADESIRMSLGRPTTEDDIEAAVSELTKATEFVRGKEMKIKSGSVM